MFFSPTNKSKFDKPRFIELLLDCPSIKDSERRKVVLNSLPDHISMAITIAHSPKEHVVNIVNTCMNFEDGIEQLIKAIQFFDEETRQFKKLISDFSGSNAPALEPTPGRSASHHKVDINRIPIPTANLVGREPELTLVNNAFSDPEKAIVAIIAGGGVGKSALIWAWLQKLKPDYKGARFFGWSFYSQGSHQTANSSAPFFQAALPFFGYQGELPTDEIDKAQLLAEYLSRQSALLILDGLEPLQHPPHILDGEMADGGVKELLRCVWRYGLEASPSLVLISTRQPVVDIEACQDYVLLDLQTFDEQDGAKLLQNLGCNGHVDELAAASRDMGGHALALVLMGRLLVKQFGGKIEARDQLPDLLTEAKEGGHALRVLQYYDEKYWQSVSPIKRFYQKLIGKNAPEQILLNLLGLFDRPMGSAEKQALFEKAKYAKPLAKLRPHELQQVEQRLEQAGLLLKDEQLGERREWDTHPLIRHYFGQALQQQHPKAYRQAQLVLFEYYQSVPAKEQPDTLEELEPLYRAVVHGYLAGEYQKALKDVYWDRIDRGNEGYNVHKLGAYAQTLTALAAFFPVGWDKPVSSGLSEANQAWLLAAASFCLMSLGRLAEAVVPRRVDIEIRKKLKDWKNVAISAENLVDLYLPIGQLQNAKEAAQQAIVYADRTDNRFHQMLSRAYFATTLHRQGDLTAAKEQFEAAEKIQAEDDPESPRLYSIYGFQYCALLLDQATDTAAREAVLERGQYGLKLSSENNQLLSIALDHLTIARALFALEQLAEALEAFKQAVQGMRKAGTTYWMPLVLLARANFHRHQQNLKEAQKDLDASFDIIHRSGMKLYQVDAVLLQTNLNLDQGKPADKEYKLAKALIAETGYHLRDGELEKTLNRI
jgi:tetratricopeptide (TPR) repeat protein